MSVGAGKYPGRESNSMNVRTGKSIRPGKRFSHLHMEEEEESNQNNPLKFVKCRVTWYF